MLAMQLAGNLKLILMKTGIIVVGKMAMNKKKFHLLLLFI